MKHFTNGEKNHQIIHFHDMIHGITPETLTILLQTKHNEIQQYLYLHSVCYAEIECQTNSQILKQFAT